MAENPTPKKSRAIGAHLLQGRQYWESAGQSGDLVRPLLPYYGTLSFCRGLILFSRRNGGEEALSKSHGLQVSEWAEEFQSKGPSAVLDFRVLTSSGTIAQLAEATRNAEISQFYVPPYPSFTNFIRCGTSGPITGTSVTVRDLIKRVPELAATHERLTGERAAAYPARVHTIPRQLVDLEVFGTEWGPSTWDSLRADLAVPADIPIEVGVPAFYDSKLASRIRAQWDQTEWLWPRLAVDESGQAWAIGPFGGDQQWSQLVILFALAFGLGMLVRYYPTIWLTLSSQPRGDLVFPLLREARSAIEESIPRLVLQLLELRVTQGALLDQRVSGQ